MSSREVEQHARARTKANLLCRSPAAHAAGRRSARTLGRAARLIEGPPLRKTNLEEKRNATNDYPERWITWLVGR